jgi:hypothetical protein
MSTAAVSSSSPNLQLQQYFHTRQTDLHQLGQALGTGDLAGAQSAFQAIAKLGQSGPFSAGAPFSNSQREQDFTAIGQALQSGNLSAAQQAFSSLKSTFEKNGGQPPQVQNPLTTNPGAPSPLGPEIVVNLSNSGSSTSPEQITINLNQTSGGGEQVSLSFGQQGSNPQQVTFNLGPNSNEEIVLNLGQPSSTSSTSSGASSGTTSGTTSGTASSSSSASGSSASGGLSVSA